MSITLRDGSRIAIRPLEPDDREAVAAGFERLSPDSRYRRFFGPMPRLSGRDLDYLTRVDHHDHEALVAVDERTGDGIGVARYVRTGDGVAEPAMVVVDDWQGRGVASLLLDALADRARSEGIRRFEAPVLANNDGAIRALRRLGPTSIRHEGREVILTIDLPDAQRGGADWGALLRQFASGSVEPARTFLDVLWPRRRGAPDTPHRNVIVVGTDGSDHARIAVEAAGELAAVDDATLEVVAVHRFLPADHERLQQAATEAADGLRGRGLHVHEHVRRGDPALVLTDLAAERNARLIVVGAGQTSKTARRLVGSTADLVAERAPCNVLIVRAR